MELFSVMVQTRVAGVNFGLTYNSKAAMDEAYVILTGDQDGVGIQLELVDDYEAEVSINTADILFVRKSSANQDLRRNAEHQFETAHANARLQRRVIGDPLLTPAARGGLVASANQ